MSLASKLYVVQRGGACRRAMIVRNPPTVLALNAVLLVVRTAVVLLYTDSGAAREDGCIACLTAERCEHSSAACGITQ